MGACLVPRVQGRWLGNLDVLRTMMENWRDGYPGMFLASSVLASAFHYSYFMTIR
jgi:hypothetical protein